MKQANLLPDGTYELVQGERTRIVSRDELEKATAEFFVDELEPVPTSVSPLQMRKALRQLGLKPTVDQFLATLDEETVEAWEYATAIERNNPFVAMATGGLGMSDEQADDLFRLAASL